MAGFKETQNLSLKRLEFTVRPETSTKNAVQDFHLRIRGVTVAYSSILSGNRGLRDFPSSHVAQRTSTVKHVWFALGFIN
jgi:hypothetical protein